MLYNKFVSNYKGDAVFDEDKARRYVLRRSWGNFDLAGRINVFEEMKRKKLLWIMLNPSYAGSNEDDRTVEKCVYFSSKFGFDSLSVVNLFSLIETESAKLIDHEIDYLIGSENDKYIGDEIKIANSVIFAYGQHRLAHLRMIQVLEQVLNYHRFVYCLGVNRDNSPRHPCRLPYKTNLEIFYDIENQDRSIQL